MRLESYHEVKDFCRQNHLLEPSDRVLVAGVPMETICKILGY